VLIGVDTARRLVYWCCTHTSQSRQVGHTRKLARRRTEIRATPESSHEMWLRYDWYGYAPLAWPGPRSAAVVVCRRLPCSCVRLAPSTTTQDRSIPPSQLLLGRSQLITKILALPIAHAAAAACIGVVFRQILLLHAILAHAAHSPPGARSKPFARPAAIRSPLTRTAHRSATKASPGDAVVWRPIALSALVAHSAWRTASARHDATASDLPRAPAPSQ